MTDDLNYNDGYDNELEQKAPAFDRRLQLAILGGAAAVIVILWMVRRAVTPAAPSSSNPFEPGTYTGDFTEGSLSVTLQHYAQATENWKRGVEARLDAMALERVEHAATSELSPIVGELPPDDPFAGDGPRPSEMVATMTPDDTVPPPAPASLSIP
jgi:hypothetical protein